MSDDLASALEASGLLRSEYPDDMARRSCTCTADAVCGAHRLLARYDQLYRAFRRANTWKRQEREARLRTQNQLDTLVARIKGEVVKHRGNPGLVHDGTAIAEYFDALLDAEDDR